MNNTTATQRQPAQPPYAHDADVSGAAPTCSLLRMAVGDEVVAVGIEDVREILQITRMTPLPRTPDFVRGVMNLRGAVVPVVDLAARLGRAPTVLGRRSCIVVVDCHADARESEGQFHQDANDNHDAQGDPDQPAKPWVMGLLVDAVFEVFDRSTAEIETAPGLGTRIAAEYLRGMTRAGGELVGVLALPRLLSARELAAGIANFQPH